MATSKTPLNTSESIQIAKAASHFLVDHINNVILKQFHKSCVKYGLKKTRDFQIVDAKLNKLSVIFETSPNGAVFDGLVSVKDIGSRDLDKQFQIEGKITRISRYGNTSSCMESYELKNFCYCKFV